MTKPTHSDPIGALGAAYEKMYERAAENLHSTEKKSAQLLHKLIDEAQGGRTKRAVRGRCGKTR